MAVGQAVLSGSSAVEALLAAEERLLERAAEASRLHAALLRDVLELERLHRAAGMPLSTVPQVALLLRCSEWRAGRLLTEALGLAELPNGLPCLEQGLLTAEQSWVVVKELAPLTPRRRVEVWQRLRVRLAADLEQGLVRPPARLSELLRRWVIAADAAAAEERRREAEADRRVEYRRRDDGLVDLLLLGLRAPEAQAVLQRIASAAEPFGPDDRTADQRRLDAAKDLLLGRHGGGDGCRPGAAAPCGADVQVHVTLGGTLGTTDEPAELVGHGPLEPDLLQAVLRSGARLTPVFTDERGVPVAVGRTVKATGSAVGVRLALLEVAEQAPPRVLHPRDPLDHDPPLQHPPDPQNPPDPQHPPGPYRAGAPLRRLLIARAPRCEFPGCGARAARCDVEHDVAWPEGPTCSCQTGPCCRRHHRVKQEGWSKHRRDGVAWTAPSGLTWLSPAQHEPPQHDVRPIPRMQVTSEDVEASPTELDEELWRLLGRPDDPEGLELRVQDVEPADADEPRLDPGVTTWTLDLHDPYAWLEPAALTD